MDGLQWCLGPTDRPHLLRYRNFASAARLLRTAYLEHNCNSPQDDEDDDDYAPSWRRQPPDCFHQSSRDMLEFLQKRAWPEIRYNVFSTAGTVLPAELTEHVFQYALSAEELPLEPDAYRKYTKGKGDRKRICYKLRPGLECHRMEHEPKSMAWRSFFSETDTDESEVDR
ncbi:uncharacterized protein LTR77_004828 [Saxophila tyrrhenica]|uniref:Uncharacterized protein n=1 Tax=Saxophila tyrrhenica TaxID=1690608 RepID=A0AAV9PDN1_9PEZI|nr:hypothetical protein LTR77_004828 [Saxophila tyrrhenica]